jgi:hypothetical protein
MTHPSNSTEVAPRTSMCPRPGPDESACASTLLGEFFEDVQHAQTEALQTMRHGARAAIDEASAATRAEDLLGLRMARVAEEHARLMQASAQVLVDTLQAQTLWVQGLQAGIAGLLDSSVEGAGQGHGVHVPARRRRH